MKRRDFLKAISIGAASLAMPGCAVGAAPKKKPNFVFIFIDDLGWKDLRCQGNPAKDGVRFSNTYAAPVCSPTRAR